MFLDQRIFASHGSRLPFAVIPVVFVLGLAAGHALSLRTGSQPPSSPARSNPVDAPPMAEVKTGSIGASPAGSPWPRTGNGAVRHLVEVTRVIDGDTFEARVHLWPGLDMTTRVRLRGIDAPELKAACPQELEMAEAANRRLQALLAEGEVSIFNIGPDKYHGRVVADAATGRTPNVSTALLTAGMARSYGGGRRSGWCSSASR